MDEEIREEFNEKFATVEEALKYIADSQAKSEFIHKRDIAEIRKLQTQTQRHLNHITQVLRFVVDEREFQEEKIEEVVKVLSRKRKK